MNLSEMTPAEFRRLFSDMAAMVPLVDTMEAIGHPPTISLTGPSRIGLPLFPAAASVPVNAAPEGTDRLIADLTRQFAAETEALAQRMGGIAIPQVSEVAEPPAEFLPPLADAAAGEDCAGGERQIAPCAELSEQAERMGLGAVVRDLAAKYPDAPCGGVTGAEGLVSEAECVPAPVITRPVIPSEVPAALVSDAKKGKAYVSPPPGTNGGPWTEAEDTLIVSDMISRHGDPVVSIAAGLATKLDRTAAAIAFRAGRALKAKIADGVKALPKTVKATPKAEKVEPAPKPAAPQLCDDVISDAESAKIMRLHDEGNSFAVIGAHMNRHPAAVAALIKRKVAERAGAGIEKAVANAKAAPAVAPVAAPTAPMSKTISAPAESPPAKETFRPSLDGLTSAPHRQLRGYLNALGYKAPWSAAMDLDLVRGLVEEGRRLPEIAADLGIDTDACKKRFATLTAYARNDKGGLTIDGQTLLLAELKVRLALIGGAA